MGILDEFKKFLMRGNIIDLAVAVVIGAAFTGVVNSLVEDMITPLLAAIVGKPDFSDLTFTINDAVFYYGSFITAVINFVLIAAAVFFLIIKPLSAAMDRLGDAEPVKIVPSGAPVIVGNTVYVTDDAGTLRAYSDSDGTMRWSAPLGSALAGAPTFVDNVLYAVTDGHELVALDTETGKELWRQTAT